MSTIMSDKADGDKSKQKTPKGHEIPIPDKEDFFDNLKKAAKPDLKKESGRRPEK